MRYQLIRDHVSQNTIEALSQLLEAAHAGEVVGMAFVVQLRRRRYFVNSCGEATRDPSLTRGQVLDLLDELGDLVRDKVDSPTTM